jgi:chromosome partitioning protein
MSKKMVKCAVFNNKGGVGKSTIAAHIAHGLALGGYKVLLIDMDGQNDASLFLGFTSQDYKKTFYDLFDGRKQTEFEECIIHARDHLDLLPSSQIDLINTELFKVSRIERVLEDKLKGLKGLGYHFVIIDCGPQRSKVNDAVLCYVDWLIIPVQLQAASVRAVGNIYEYLSDMRLDTGMIKLIVPNMFDQRTNDSKENLVLLKEFISDDDVLTEPIHRRVKIAEAGKLGKTVFEYDDESAQQFLSIVNKVISRYAQEK